MQWENKLHRRLTIQHFESCLHAIKLKRRKTNFHCQLKITSHNHKNEPLKAPPKEREHDEIYWKQRKKFRRQADKSFNARSENYERFVKKQLRVILSLGQSKNEELLSF